MVIGLSFSGAAYLLSELSSTTQMVGIKYYFLAQIIYSATTIPVRCSICFTLLRIADAKKRFCYALYVIIALTVTAGLATIAGVLNACRPIRSFWGEVEGECSTKVSINIGYFLSATCIATDLALAILPAMMLWGVQIKLRVKIYIVTILALGALASCATIVRLPYLMRYAEPDRILATAAPLTCWTMVEVGIGICAGSVAQLRPLLQYVPFIKHTSYAGHTGPEDRSRTLRSRVGTVKLTTFHHEGKRTDTSESARRIHGRDELDLATDSDVDSQDERLNNAQSVSSGTTAFPDDVKATATGTIRKETEVVVQPWVPQGQDTVSVASTEAIGVATPIQPDFTFRDAGNCRTEIWHRQSRG